MTSCSMPVVADNPPLPVVEEHDSSEDVDGDALLAQLLVPSNVEVDNTSYIGKGNVDPYLNGLCTDLKESAIVNLEKIKPLPDFPLGLKQVNFSDVDKSKKQGNEGQNCSQKKIAGIRF